MRRYARELGAHALAQFGVEIGKRFVEEEDIGLDHERASERDAPLLPAGEFARVALLETGQIDQRERVRDFLLRIGSGHLAKLEAEDNVFVDVLVRPDRVVLEHHAHAARFRRHHCAGRGEHAAGDLDRAAIGHDVTRDQAQRRRLAAAGGAEQRDEGIVLDLDVEVGDGGDFGVLAKALRQTA